MIADKPTAPKASIFNSLGDNQYEKHVGGEGESITGGHYKRQPSIVRTYPGESPSEWTEKILHDIFYGGWHGVTSKDRQYLRAYLQRYLVARDPHGEFVPLMNDWATKLFGPTDMHFFDRPAVVFMTLVDDVIDSQDATPELVPDYLFSRIRHLEFLEKSLTKDSIDRHAETIRRIYKASKNLTRKLSVFDDHVNDEILRTIFDGIFPWTKKDVGFYALWSARWRESKGAHTAVAATWFESNWPWMNSSDQAEEARCAFRNLVTLASEYQICDPESRQHRKQTIDAVRAIFAAGIEQPEPKHEPEDVSDMVPERLRTSEDTAVVTAFPKNSVYDNAVSETEQKTMELIFGGLNLPKDRRTNEFEWLRKFNRMIGDYGQTARDKFDFEKARDDWTGAVFMVAHHVPGHSDLVNLFSDYATMCIGHVTEQKIVNERDLVVAAQAVLKRYEEIKSHLTGSKLKPMTPKPDTPDDRKDDPIAPFVNKAPGLLSDRMIRALVKTGGMMIDPYSPDQVRVNEDNESIISYGQSSFGYDVRLADEFKIFTNVNSAHVDPKNFTSQVFVDHKGPHCLIPPNSFVLARTMERFRVPRDVLIVCLGKSTYARVGVICNVTPLEPEWEGQVTLEFSNTTPLPVKLYAFEGCAQLLFFRSPEECEKSYADRSGKYQGQMGVTAPRL